MAQDIVNTVDPVLSRIPIVLRQEYLSAWDAYGASCRLNRPKRECEEVYARARMVEERFTAAYVVAQSEHKREENRKKARAVRS